MRDVLPSLMHWWRAGDAAGLATVTATWSSAPRQPGAAMAVGPDGTAVGSVSGGCVEGAVYELCREIAGADEPRIVRMGVSDDDALGVGLTCGGTVELLIERVDRATFPELPELAAAIAAGRPVALLTRLEDARHLVLTREPRTGSLGPEWLAGQALDLLTAGRSGLLRPAEGSSVLVSSFPPPARMIVFGATDHAAATAGIGSFLGFHVTVCDARPVFATAVRFPAADRVVVDWPHRYLAAEAEAGRIDARTVLCVLTHDPKFDVPVLEVAVRLPVAYVGVMGSRRTHHDRLRRLREAGLTEVDLARLASPVGLDLGARTPEETAVSIAAEIIAVRGGGTGVRLSTTDGPIHPRA